MKSDPIRIRGSLEKSWTEGVEEAKLLFGEERPPPVIIVIVVVIIITIVITMMLVALSRISCNQDDLSSKL